MSTPPDMPSGGWAENRWVEFRLFILQLLEQDPEIEVPAGSMPYGAHHGFEFEARRNCRPLLVEATQITPQTTRRLDQLCAQLKSAAAQYADLHRGPEPELILACAGLVCGPMRELAARSGVRLWDGPYLSSTAQRLGVRIPQYLASALPDAIGRTDPAFLHTRSLVERLQSIAPGQKGWSFYEKYCEDLLNFLFVPPLKPAIPQSRDAQNANRRDYIFPNYADKPGFWQFMRTHYDAHFVVAEVKNLSSGPGKDEILQVANYLNPRGLGLFALILARCELNETAEWTCREQWIQHNKLIIGINDVDVRQMVETKLAGGDPAELVRQKIEDFRLRI